MENIKKTIGTLNEDEFGDLHNAVKEEAEKRRPKATLEMIRPNMSKEDDAAVRAELARALKELGI